MSVVFGVEKGCVFTKHWCFRELVKRYPSIFLITLSQTMNTNGLDFWGLVGFEMLVRWFVSFFIRGSIFFIHYMAHLVHIWGCNFCIGQMRYYIWITLSICFALLFSFGNFVNWWLSSDWMGFEYTIDNQYTIIATFFILLEILSSFGLSHWLLVLHPQCSNEIVFLFYFLP